jgi:hypothetical protein
VTLAGAGDPDAVVASLTRAAAGDGCSVLAGRSDGDAASFVVSAPDRGDAALFSYRQLAAAAASAGARVTGIGWGIDPEGDPAADGLCWHCRRPYGARQAPEATTAALGEAGD